MDVKQHVEVCSIYPRIIYYERVSVSFMYMYPLRDVFTFFWLYQIMERHMKFPALLKHLKSVPNFGRVLLFVETKRGADQLTSQLLRNGNAAVALHGDKTQDERYMITILLPVNIYIYSTPNTHFHERSLSVFHHHIPNPFYLKC